MKYIAAREVFGGSHLYFQDNINDSPKWTDEKEKAMRFENAEDAETKSDRTGLYSGDIIAMRVEE